MILFLFGVQMVFGNVLSENTVAEPGRDVAVFAGDARHRESGAIAAVVLLTDNHRHSIAEQAVTAAVLIVVLAITIGLLYAANVVHKILGSTERTF